MKLIKVALFIGLLFGQTYTTRDFVSDFGADICYNGNVPNEYWSWNEHGQNKVTWISSFATW